MKYNTQPIKRSFVSCLVGWSVEHLPGNFGKYRACLAPLLFLIAVSGEAQVPAPDAETSSASPLQILQAVPKVHIDDPQPEGFGEQRSPRRRVTPAPSPTPEKKPGIMRGMIRAIPFVGPKIAGPREVEPTPLPGSIHDEQMGEDVEPSSPPPGRAPTRLKLDADETPTGPSYAPSYIAPGTPRIQAPAGSAVPPPSAGGQDVLTVKVAGSDSTSSSTIETPTTKAPEFARHESTETVTSTAVSAVTPPVASSSAVTSPSIEAADLGMPNPAYEQNEVIRAEYVDAVKTARAGDYEKAAQLFHDYAANHTASGLTPRALFLAALLSTSAEKAAESEKTLRERFPKSRFLSELEKRNRARAKEMATPTPVPDEQPSQAAARLEAELTEAVGSSDREVPLRLRLGQAYLSLEEYERALEIMRPAADMARGRAEEPDILILISECYIATRRNPQAVTLLADVLQRFPAAPQRPRALYDYGLVNEATGNFERARAMYNELRQNWPASAEAAQAIQRLKDMERLAE
jgi:TolA-binding protein